MRFFKHSNYVYDEVGISFGRHIFSVRRNTYFKGKPVSLWYTRPYKGEVKTTYIATHPLRVRSQVTPF